MLRAGLVFVVLVLTPALGISTLGAEKKSTARDQKDTESFLHVGMQWKGTFERVTPDKLNAYRINKEFRHPQVNQFRLKVTHVEGPNFGGQFHIMGGSELEFMGVLARNYGFQIKFTKLLNGGSNFVMDGAGLAGTFSPDGEKIQGSFQNTRGEGRFGTRVGTIDGTLMKKKPEQGDYKKKNNKDKDKE